MMHKIMAPEDRTRWVCKAFAIHHMKEKYLTPERATDDWDAVTCPKCLALKLHLNLEDL